MEPLCGRGRIGGAAPFQPGIGSFATSGAPVSTALLRSGPGTTAGAAAWAPGACAPLDGSSRLLIGDTAFPALVDESWIAAHTITNADVRPEVASVYWDATAPGTFRSRVYSRAEARDLTIAHVLADAGWVPLVMGTDYHVEAHLLDASHSEVGTIPFTVTACMPVNLLTAHQATAEGASDGSWAATAGSLAVTAAWAREGTQAFRLTAAAPPPVNMLTTAQATCEGADIPLPQALSYRLAGWAANYTVNRVGRTHQFGTGPGQPALMVVRPDATAVALGLCASPSTAGTYGPRFTAVAGQTYTFMAEGRSSAAGVTKGAWKPRMTFYDAANTQIGAVIESVIPGLDQQFAPGRLVAVAPAGTVAMCVGVSTNAAHAANGTEWFYWRKLGLFAGDVPTSAWVSPAATWGQNLLDPERADCETNIITDDNTVKCGWRQGITNGGTAQWITDGRHGTRCVKIVPTAAVTPVLQPKTVGPLANYLIPVTPGKAYTAVFSSKCSAAVPLSSGGQAYFRYQWFKADKTTSIGTLDWTHLEPIPAGQWTDWVASAIAPPEAAWAYMTCYQQYSPILPVGTEHTLDCFGFYEGYVGGWHHPSEPRPDSVAKSVGLLDAAGALDVTVLGSAWIDVAATFTVQMDWLKAGDVPNGSTWTPVTVTPGAWSDWAVVAQPPPGTTKCRLSLIGSANPGVTVDVDKLMYATGKWGTINWVPPG